MGDNTKTKGRTNWKINLKEACEKQGIENPFQLWKKIGGSKATTAKMWLGETTMIKTETMNRLQSIVGITPFEYLTNQPD